jgi:hypothetical protein
MLHAVEHSVQGGVRKGGVRKGGVRIRGVQIGGRLFQANNASCCITWRTGQCQKRRCPEKRCPDKRCPDRRSIVAGQQCSMLYNTACRVVSEKEVSGKEVSR